MALLAWIMGREAAICPGQLGLLSSVGRQEEARRCLQDLPTTLHDLRRVRADYARGHNACVAVEGVGVQEPANVPGYLLASSGRVSCRLGSRIGQVYGGLGALLQRAQERITVHKFGGGPRSCEENSAGKAGRIRAESFRPGRDSTNGWAAALTSGGNARPRYCGMWTRHLACFNRRWYLRMAVSQSL